MNAGWGGGGGGGVLVPDGFIMTQLKKYAQNIRALAFFLLLQKRQKYQLGSIFVRSCFSNHNYYLVGFL